MATGNKPDITSADYAMRKERVSDSSQGTGSILDVELAKQVERSPEYYVCPYTGNKIEN